MKKDAKILLGVAVGLLLLSKAKKGGGIGAIHKTKPPGKLQCKDGTFTDSVFGGRCSYHGGLMNRNITPSVAPQKKQGYTHNEIYLQDLARRASSNTNNLNELYRIKNLYDGINESALLKNERFYYETGLNFLNKEIERLEAKERKKKKFTPSVAPQNIKMPNVIPTYTSESTKDLVNDLFSDVLPQLKQHEAVKNTAAAFGWQAEKTPTGYNLINRKNVAVATVEVKGDTYKIFDRANNKLLGGRGQLPKAVETIIDKYFYGQRVSTPSVNGIKFLSI